MQIKRSYGERIFEVFNITFMLLLACVTVYPLWHVAIASVSDPVQFMAHRGILLKPYGFSLLSYKAVFENRMVVIGYTNTIIYVVAGTAINLLITSLGAYVLSRKSVYWRNAMMFMVVFTMFFSGGLIPSFLLVQALHLKNTIGAIILPTAVSAWNLIIMRTAFMEIPDSLEESARIDGANDFIIFFRIILPLSKAIIAVMLLFYGVQNWNKWFDAMIYLTDKSLYPLQLVLRDILISNQTEDMMTDVVENREKISQTIQYATIMVATLPVMCIYPFMQKYFVKGVMIGAVKG